MCQSPSHVWVKRGPESVQVPVPCDMCWSCRENYVSDWVGRCLCEASVSEVSCTVSLTYATPRNPLDLSNRVVNPYHFQLFMKRLRKAGHKVRYLVAGEYGDLRDRAHFHAILFFKRLKPTKRPGPYLLNREAFLEDPSRALPFSREIPQEEMVHISEWPHGHIQVDWSCTDRSIRYCCEYLNPQAGKKTGWFSMSKKPALGFEWFAAKAERNREFGVLPSSFEYLPPGGKPGKVYLMTGATRRDYLNMITTNRADRPRMSKWVRATFDKLERAEFARGCEAFFDDEAFVARQEPEAKVRSRLVLQDYLADRAGERMLAGIAAEWGFDHVEEWQAFMASGGSAEHPEYYLGPQSRDVQNGRCARPGSGHPQCACAACEERRARAASVAAARRKPIRFDRQGKPQFGPEGRDYLAGAFARGEAEGEAGDDDGMQAPAAGIE